MTLEDVRDRLAREDPDYRRLVEQHRELDQRLEVLRTQRWLSDEERLEETRLKKMKLALKDDMEALVRRVGA